MTDRWGARRCRTFLNEECRLHVGVGSHRHNPFLLKIRNRMHNLIMYPNPPASPESVDLQRGYSAANPPESSPSPC